MKMSNLLQILLVVLCVFSASGAKISKGWLTLNVATGDRQQQYEVAYNGRIKETIELTQSSRIDIQAKVI